MLLGSEFEQRQCRMLSRVDGAGRLVQMGCGRLPIRVGVPGLALNPHPLG